MYSHPSQFTPLIPSESAFSLLEDEAREVVAQSYALTHAAHPATLSRIRELVRSMNSSYSNLIEGQSTHPANIDRALRKDFSDNLEVAKKQRIALAHIEAEKALEQMPSVLSRPFSIDAVKACHSGIYDRLTEEDKATMMAEAIYLSGLWLIGRRYSSGPAKIRLNSSVKFSTWMA